MLGCGEWVVLIFERGGRTLLDELDIATLSASPLRTQSETTQVDMSIACRDCGMTKPEPWRHEMHLVRSVDVTSTVEWIGVPYYSLWRSDSVQILARDLTTWLDHRVLESTQSFENAPLHDIFRWVVEEALLRDASPAISVDLEATIVTATRLIQAVDRRVAGEELREIARSGLDFTQIGRTLRAQPSDSRRRLPGVLEAQHVDDPSVETVGTDTATEAFALGRTIEVEGRAGGVTDAYGLVQGVVTELRGLDVSSLQEAVQLRVAQSERPPRRLRARLLPASPWTFPELIPGLLAEVHMDVNCESIDEMMRLTDVEVQVGETEEVGVTLVSA